jgi:hypothetical protein
MVGGWMRGYEIEIKTPVLSEGSYGSGQETQYQESLRSPY